MAIESFHMTLTLTTTTGSVVSSRPLFGAVRSVYVKYTSQSGPPSLIIKTQGTSQQMPTVTVLALASANTDGYFTPLQPTVKSSDGTAIATWFDSIYVADYITVAVTAGGVAGSIDVWLMLENSD